MLLTAVILLFAARVLGQILVVLFGPRWLPPMQEWYSGLVPYSVLLAFQILFLAAMSFIAIQFLGGRGPLVVPRPALGRIVLAFSLIYAGSMLIRYVIRMLRRPDQRWFGGTIPIFFHIVIASYLFVFSVYQLR